MSDLSIRYTKVQHEVTQFATTHGLRIPDLLAVSKTRTVTEIQELINLGQTAFGENYVDEAEAKIAALQTQGITWHFIGPIQSNKTRRIATHFDWVQSVSRSKEIRRLSAQRPDGMNALNICLQVNIDAESQKAGCRPDQIMELAELVTALPRLKLRGLMAIPRAGTTNGHLRMAELFHAMQSDDAGVDTLSLGMSGDWQPALRTGSTMLRVGTALFGPRE